MLGSRKGSNAIKVDLGWEKHFYLKIKLPQKSTYSFTGGFQSWLITTNQVQIFFKHAHCRKTALRTA